MDDKKYLKLAKDLASKSQESIQCGSVLVNDMGEVVASNFNSQRADNLTASHAEMKSIAEANKKVGRKLSGFTAYGNCEPCTMCLTALIFAGVDKIVFATRLNDLVEPTKQIHILIALNLLKTFHTSRRLNISSSDFGIPGAL